MSGARILLVLMLFTAAGWSIALLYPVYRYLSPPHARGPVESASARRGGAGIDDGAGPSPCRL